MRRTAHSPRARMICLVVCFSLLAQSLLLTTAGASADTGAGEAAPQAGQGAAHRGVRESEAADLPDLDEARRRPRHEPRAVPPVPSRRRRCPPRNRRCNEETDGAPRPTPAPSPTPPGRGNPHSVASAAALTLASLAAALGGAAPLMELPLLDFYRGGGGYSVSDAPASPPVLPAADIGGYDASPLVLFQGGRPRVNVAAASAGATAAATSSYDGIGLSAANAINGSRTNAGSYWNDQTHNDFPDSLQVIFAGVKNVEEVDVFLLQDNLGTAEPTESMTFTQYGLTSFEVQYFTGNVWLTVPGGSVASNNRVWVKLTFPAIRTERLRVLATGAPDGWSRVVEVEAYEAPTNVAAAANGATAFGSSSYEAYGLTAANAINGSRTHAGSYWNDQTAGAFPDWLQVNFSGSKTIDEIDVFSLQDNLATGEPSEATTFTQYGLTSFEVQYRSGVSWVTVPGGAVAGNNRVWRKFTFPAVTTDRIRVLVNGAADGWSRVAEVEAYEAASAGGGQAADDDGTGLTASYYDNDDFTAHVFTRTDPTVNFNWGVGSPSGAVGADTFAVRWEGMVVPRHTEDYTFYTATDDGVRLWVDGVQVIDRWVDQGVTEHQGVWPDAARARLVAGRPYSIRMEYYERWGGAYAALQWSSASQPKEVIPRSRLLPCWKEPGQFVRDSYEGAVGRPPTSAETQQWANHLALAQGYDQLVERARYLGRTLFASAEYAARNPDPNPGLSPEEAARRFVADLYRGFLQREPDASGWDFWTANTLAHGRAATLSAFEMSAEFYEKVRQLCGTSASAAANGGAGYNFSTARLDPSNRTGGAGADPYSRNYNFQIPLVSLPGRAGLDLGLTLSYNSLVWAKDSSGITYDADEGFPSAGFRLGFPTIEPKFFNPATGRLAYLLVTPSGARVELRQTAAPGVYESADSSYLQLTEGNGVLTLVSTDGARMSFYMAGGSYRCQEVRDRNGNFIGAGYHGDGRLDWVADTLGRVIYFEYDSFQNLVRITQPWKRETEAHPAGQDEMHEWATFGYADVTLQPQFEDLAVMGDQPGAVLPLLNQVGLADGSYYRFEYNAWGQVYKATRYASDAVDAQGKPNLSHPLSSTWLGLPGAGASHGGAGGVAASPQRDCPRFAEQRVWVEHGVMGQSAEVVTTYSTWAPNMASCDVSVPDGSGTFYRDIYETAGWKRGLVAQSEVWSGGQRRKWTTLAWTQDDTSAGYRVNPRVEETNVYDAEGNRRRTAVDYGPYARHGLPYVVTEYAADGTTPLRRTYTDYELSQAYKERRIIGLVSARHVQDGASGQYIAKTTYAYDEPGGVGAQAAAAPGHDQSYGASFLTRGNVTSVTRWDAGDVVNAAKALTTRLTYDAAGSTLSSTDPAGHRTTVGYSDSFSDGGNARGTFAYPTTLTDADGFSSSARYNYSFGARTRAEGPPPAGQTVGLIENFAYDAAGRLLRATTGNTGAYTRYAYYGDFTQRFSTVNSVADEAYAIEIFDGLGRVRAAASNHPGSEGKYRGQVTQYDEAGRAVKESNPAEIDGSWKAVGDDAAAGWAYTAQSYDWRGRPLVTTNTDGTRRRADYGGCGCAGGEVVTLADEVGRRQRLYSDALGRRWKAEVLNWDGMVYSTTISTFNALDRVTAVRQYQGTEQGGVYQEEVMTYDGHGRLQSRHTPEQDAGAATVYAYNADDTPSSATDARGATATYTYNNRHLVTGVGYSAPSGIAAPAAVTYGYDAAGNRTSMADGQGSTSYHYDALSRMDWEERQFVGLTGAYRLTYTYNLAGELTSVYENNSGQKVDYGYDSAGRLLSVSGVGYPGMSQFASDIRYRAWGAPKSGNYGDGRSLSVTYDKRLRPATYKVPGLLDKTYDYDADGMLRYAADQLDPRYDRLHQYDHAGRLKEARTGQQARGGAAMDGPYRQSYTYDVWGNTQTETRRWTQADAFTTNDYVSGRNPLWTYDSAGNVTSDAGRLYKYDAAGSMVSIAGENDPTHPTRTHAYDGDGARLKSAQRPEFTYQMFDTYYLRSTVLGGQVVAEILGGGQKSRGYVYTPEGGRLAFHQLPIPGDVGNYVGIEHTDASGQSVRVGGAQQFDAELDAVGVQMGTAEQWVEPEPAPTPDETDPSLFPSYGNPRNQVGLRCSRDGIPRECEDILGNLKSGRFTFLYAAARQSARFLGVRLHVEYEGARERGVLLRWWAMNIYDESWGFAPAAFGGAGVAQAVQPQEPQNTSSNPNCFMYAVRGNPNPGIARGYTNGHNGYHSLGPGKVFALAPMVGGEVKKVTLGDTSPDAFNTIVDIAIPGGKYVAILADMGKVSLRPDNIIRAGQQIGVVTGGPGTKGGYGVIDGLHFALILAEYYDEYRRLTPDAAHLYSPKHKEAVAKIDANQSKWFADPLKEGTFQCPGITSRTDMPIRNGVPTRYPIP